MTAVTQTAVEAGEREVEDGEIPVLCTRSKTGRVIYGREGREVDSQARKGRVYPFLGRW